jgi:hypothetical protein
MLDKNLSCFGRYGTPFSQSPELMLRAVFDLLSTALRFHRYLLVLLISFIQPIAPLATYLILLTHKTRLYLQRQAGLKDQTKRASGSSPRRDFLCGSIAQWRKLVSWASDRVSIYFLTEVVMVKECRYEWVFLRGRGR